MVINAVAGSGKTSTILNSIELIPAKSRRKIAFVAFNNKIVQELKTKTPPSVMVTTMHKLGLGCVRRANNGKAPIVNSFNEKLRRELTELAIQLEWLAQDKYESHNSFRGRVKDYVNQLVPLVDLCKMYLALDASAISIVSSRHNFSQLEERDFNRVEHAFKVLYENPDLREISLADMIFYPAHGIVPMHRYDFVYVDECQDLNKCQQKCIELMIEGGGRFVAVGDPKQAIYGFQGSDIKAFEAFSTKPNTKMLELSDCFRCSKVIVSFAQMLNPAIKPFHKAKEGRVRYGSYSEASPGDYVLCRLNAPLVSLCLMYLKKGIPASIVDTDLDKSLKNFIKTHSPKGGAISELFKSINDAISELKSSLLVKDLNEEEVEKNSEVQSLIDRLSVIQVLATGCYDTSDIIRKIDSLFSGESDSILLSSIHKSKGLEANRVFILGDDLMPLKRAELEWEKEQEENLMYVAYTRAKSELIFIDDIDDYSQPGYGSLKRSERLDDFLAMNGSALY